MQSKQYKSIRLFTGVEKWPMLFPICTDNTATSRQSPIDIQTTNTKFNVNLKPLKLTGYNIEDSNPMELTNNGHSIVVSMGTNAFNSKVEHKGIKTDLRT